MMAQATAAATIREVPLQPSDLLDLMIRLAELLEHETALLQAGRIGDIGPLQREKQRLAALQQTALKQVTAAGAFSQAAPLRAQLVAAARHLAAAVSENELALRIGRTAARRLLDMVVESINAQRQRTSRYTARLVVASGGSPVAVALDRRL